MPQATVTDLSAESWRLVARRTARKFVRDQCPDRAAALTYYAVLALFPAALAVLSVVGLLGERHSTVSTVLSIVDDIGAGSVSVVLKPALEELSRASGAGLVLVLGIAGALWSASRYVTAFGRSLNQMYDVEEGRPYWKLRPLMILLTAVLVVLSALTLVGLVISGPVARAIGSSMGLADTTVTIWGIAKWPVLLAVVVVIVALLYWGTPNVRHPRFRWISVGAVAAILTWILLSALFGLYVANFGSFSRTYGSLAGVIVFLLWLWLTNLALLFGAELDAEIERGRELHAGVAAEAGLRLAPRDTTAIRKQDQREREDIAAGRRIRRTEADQP